MGNSGGGLPPKTTIAAEASHSENPGPSSRSPIRLSGTPLNVTDNEVPSSRDENFDQEKDVSHLGRSQTLQMSQDVDYISTFTEKNISSSHSAAVEGDDEKPGSSAAQSIQRPQPSLIAMTSVTLPMHQDSEPSEASPPPSTGIAFPPYRGEFPSHMSIPPFPSYLPIGPGQSYSAMLASMGTQFQMAQEQGHHLLQHPYIPGGYITLPSPSVSMSPVLIPAASLHDVPRSNIVPKTSAGHIPSAGPRTHLSAAISTHRPYDLTHSKAEHHHMNPSNRPGNYGNIHPETFTVGRAYVPAPQGSLMPPLLRRSTDVSQPHGTHSLSQNQIPSLEAVLGKTTYPHASGPGGIKIELPPPTIGIHIGARPSNLGHPNMPLPPPLVHKSNLFIEPGRESSKVVPSSLGAPMSCIGEPFGGGMTTPYIQQLKSRHSHTMSHSQLEKTSAGPHSGAIADSCVKSSLAYPSNSSGESELHSTSNPGVKPWPTNPSHVNIPEPFQVKQEPGTRDAVKEGLGSHSADGHESLKDRKSVQSSRPILTSQAPPPMANVPSYFTRGSIIQLANGQLRRVEELQTEDFITSAQVTDGLKIDSSTVSKIDEDLDRNVANISFLVGEHNAQVTVEARLDHPFFVYGQGWSSVSPEFSLKCYALNCHTLSVGDVCISLTVMEKTSPEPGRPPPPPAGSDSARAIHSKQLIISSPERKRQRFHETRMAHFEESVERESAVARVPTSVNSKALEQQSISGNPGEPSQAEGVVVDQNRNIVASHNSKTPVQRDVAQERWNQPPKRRWSDPIKSSQAPESKDKLPNAPHPSSLSKLTEES